MPPYETALKLARSLEDSISLRSRPLTDMTLAHIMRLAAEHNAVNLALGAPDFPAPDELKQAAAQAILGDFNQYTNTWGYKPLREAIAQTIRRRAGIDLDADTELTVTCGTTEAMLDVLMTLTDPGDEIIVFEPFYENYILAARLCGVTARYVTLHRPDWRFDERELATAFTSRTKAILLNTPNNPTGKVFSREELQCIARLCRRWGVLCVSDEIYEHMVFDDAEHLSPIQLPDMRDRTLVVSGLSKTYTATGWRIGYVIGPPAITQVIRRVHDCATAGAPAPLQLAGVTAYSLDESYYHQLRQDYQARRDRLIRLLNAVGFQCYTPQGAFYLMADISRFGFADESDFVTFLIKELRVAAAPGSCFYAQPAKPTGMVRFCFGKADQTLSLVEERLARLAHRHTMP